MLVKYWAWERLNNKDGNWLGAGWAKSHKKLWRGMMACVERINRIRRMTRWLEITTSLLQTCKLCLNNLFAVNLQIMRMIAHTNFHYYLMALSYFWYYNPIILFCWWILHSSRWNHWPIKKRWSCGPRSKLLDWRFGNFLQSLLNILMRYIIL